MGRTLDALDGEWGRVARTDGAREALRGWADEHPVLAGAEDLDEVLFRRRDPGLGCSVLADHAPDGA